jgi:hypothetical protein
MKGSRLREGEQVNRGFSVSAIPSKIYHQLLRVNKETDQHAVMIKKIGTHGTILTCPLNLNLEHDGYK